VNSNALIFCSILKFATTTLVSSPSLLQQLEFRARVCYLNFFLSNPVKSNSVENHSKILLNGFTQ
jgi:hypothetical protein